MRIKSSVGLAVGPADATHWGQVLTLPTAYGIIEIEDDSGAAQRRGIQALSGLGEALSQDIVSLKALEDLAVKTKHAAIVSLILLVPVGHVVYIVMRGSGSVYIKRGKELAQLMSQDGGISGELQIGDTIVLASRGFSGVLPHEELTRLFDHLTPAEIAEKLTLMLHEKIDGAGSVALVFEATSFEDEAKKLIPELEDETTPIENQHSEGSTPLTAPPRINRVSHLIETAKRKTKLIVDSLRRDSKKMTVLITLTSTTLFLICVALGIWKQTSAKKNQQMVTVTSEAQYTMDEGVALISLNPTKGKARLEKAKQLLDPYVIKGNPVTTQEYKLMELYRKITDNLTQAMQIVETPSPLFYDVSLLKAGAMATSFTLDGINLAIGDETTGTVYKLDIASKNAQILGGGNTLKGVRSVTIHGDSVYALTPDGIVAIGLSDKKPSLIIKKDEKWGVLSSLVSFGGNLYLADTQKSRIWKYVAVDESNGGSGFSELHEYLNPDTLPDFSRVTGMVIDGSIWMGTTDGHILRFTQGKENTFISSGVEPAFGSNLIVYTSDDTANIYVLDTEKSRVVILDKDGTYLSQYRYQSSLKPQRLVVSEAQKKMLLLAAGKIYAIDIK